MESIYATVDVNETRHINATNICTKFINSYKEGKLFFLAGWGGKFFEVVFKLNNTVDLPKDPTLETVQDLLVENRATLYYIAAKHHIELKEMQIMKVAPPYQGHEDPNSKNYLLPE